MAPPQKSGPDRNVSPVWQLSLAPGEAFDEEQAERDLAALWRATGPDDATMRDTVDDHATVMREGPGFVLPADSDWVNPEISLVSYRHRDEQTTPRSALIPAGHTAVIELSVVAALDQDELPELELRVVDDDTGEPVSNVDRAQYFDEPGELTVTVAAGVDPGWYRWELRAPAGPVTVLGTTVFVDATLQR